MTIDTEEELAFAIEQLHAIGTDNACIELKRAKGGMPEIATTISAFSNTSGGSIVFGIIESDFLPDKDLDVRKIQTGCAHAARELVTPPVQADIKILPYKGIPVVVANIPEAPLSRKPVYVKKQGCLRGSYIRSGDGDHLLTSYEIDRLKENSVRTAKLDLVNVVEATPDDLDGRKVEKWIEEVRRHSSGKSQVLDDRELLLNRRVLGVGINGKTYPTVAGLMAMGVFPQKFYPRANVVFVHYPTNTKGDSTANQRYLDKQEIDGCIPEMIIATVNAVSRNMAHAGVVNGALRTNVPDYPEVAIREAVANALLHRDYSDEGCASPVLVELFPNRLVITNPGGLFGSLTVDDLMNSPMPVSRNANLSRILGDVTYSDSTINGNLVENLGSGIPTILDTLKKANMEPPKFESSLDQFSITMWRRQSANNPLITGPISSNELRVREYFHTHLLGSAQDVATTLGISLQTARKYLNKMIDEGELEGIGAKNSPRYHYRLIQ